MAGHLPLKLQFSTQCAIITMYSGTSPRRPQFMICSWWVIFGMERPISAVWRGSCQLGLVCDRVATDYSAVFYVRHFHVLRPKCIVFYVKKDEKRKSAEYKTLPNNLWPLYKPYTCIEWSRNVGLATLLDKRIENTCKCPIT